MAESMTGQLRERIPGALRLDKCSEGSDSSKVAGGAGELKEMPPEVG